MILDSNGQAEMRYVLETYAASNAIVRMHHVGGPPFLARIHQLGQQMLHCELLNSKTRKPLGWMHMPLSMVYRVDQHADDNELADWQKLEATYQLPHQHPDS